MLNQISYYNYRVATVLGMNCAVIKHIIIYEKVTAK